MSTKNDKGVSVMNIVEILKDAPIGTKLYSVVHGEVKLKSVNYNAGLYPITIWVDGLGDVSLTKYGYYFHNIPDSCPILFPSKKQRDWSKFKLDLPKNTPVVLFESVCSPFSASIRKYAGDGRYVLLSGDTNTYPYIVPFDKIEIKDGEFTFNEKDNYGTQRKEDEI